jgi:hypothetical protein
MKPAASPSLRVVITAILPLRYTPTCCALKVASSVSLLSFVNQQNSRARSTRRRPSQSKVKERIVTFLP